MKRNASAKWEGTLEDGNGTLTTDSEVLKDTRYSFSTRFKDGKGTNPEELIGAAHAGCYAMALSMILGQHDLTAEQIDARASVSLEQSDGGFDITTVHLTVRAKVPGADAETFRKAAEETKVGCPVSKVLNAKITLDAELVD